MKSIFSKGNTQKMEPMRTFLIATLAWQMTSVCMAQVTPKTDVVFLLDSSNAVGPAKLASLRAFLLDLVQQWNIGPDAVQVSAVSYGSGINEEFDLDDNGDLQSAKQAILSVPFRGGTSDQAAGIKYARETSFTPAHGARPDANHVIIHVTDQTPADPAAAAREAQLARDKGVKIYNIAVSDGSVTQQVQNMTSDPQSRYLLTSDTYSSLKSLTPVLGSRINNEVPRSPANLPAPSSCVQKADLIFLIDSSSSVGQNDFHHLEDFLKDVIVQLPVQSDKVRVGVAQYGNHPSLEFGLDIYSERLSMMRAVDGIKFMGGGTNTGNAIDYATDKMFTPALGARQDVPHIAVVITDGQSGDQTATKAAADRARQQGVNLFALGVGHNVDQTELANIADDPDNGHVFQAGSYKDLKGLSKQILDAACKVKPVATTAPTSASGESSPKPCLDKLDNCGYYSKDTCNDYRPWAEENCAKFCGFCTVIQDVTPCDDQVDCSGYPLSVCTDPNYMSWNTVNCPRYCGLCPDTSDPLGYYGMCFYKGVAYPHGEKWLDGCDYECVCEDGNTGTYRCYNRCPVYESLPRECTLIAVPGECCLQPVCDFDQKVTTTQGSGKGVNSQGIDMCVYAGLQYYNGQSWEIGCDQRCTCTNAKLGTYVCQSYCPTYTAVPSFCRLVRRPGECCETPVCEFDTVTGVKEGHGTTSGRGIAANPAPVCVDKHPHCKAAGTAACQDFPQWAQEHCALFCNLCAPVAPSADPEDRCLYEGKAYRKGETWNAGCDLECTCEEPALGYYRCDSKCPTYKNLPSNCTTVKEDGECCPQTVCATGSFYPSSTNVTSVGNGDSLSQKLGGGQVVSVLPSQTPRTASGGSVNFSWRNRIDGCLFQGKAFVQGQQWLVGCQLSCVCTDATVGKYQCRERCPVYENVPATCKMVTDPADTCCTYPTDCGPGTNYVPIPVYSPNVTSVGAVMSPSVTDLLSGQYTTQLTVALDGITVQAPTTPSSSGSGTGYCLYKNVRYPHGVTWEDGCQYNCVCEDGSTGTYRCIEKCETYVNLPAQYCHLEQDPNNPCCERPVCNFMAGHGEIRGNRSSTLAPAPPTPVSPTMRPPPGTTSTPPVPSPNSPKTVAPPTVTPPTQRPTPGKVPAMCIYEGEMYTEGQTWYDACDFKCTCVDGLNNSYTCLTRCPQYEGDFTACTQVADPEDPQCCSVPSCTGKAIPPGQFTGTGTVPTRDKCLYKGSLYNAGDVWEDGCRLQCECTDPGIGLYECTDRCPKVAEVPQGCTLVPDVGNRCCQTVQCSPWPGGSNLTPPKTNVCVYQQATYYEGQTWNDGCQQQCRCEQEGIFTCTERCPTYENLPPECVLVTSDLDPCCKAPQCSPQTGQVPVLPPKVVTGVAQSPDPGNVPRLGACLYKGVLRGQGEQWYDGCEYSCTCEDALTGKYKCTERCPSYGAVPPECQLVKDASEPCCEVAVCDPTYVTPAPGATTTLSPPRSGFVCVYDGQSYTQGQAWYTGCDYRCVCEDADQGVYRCTDRCSQLSGSLPNECKLVPDPNDPLCCEVASCSPAKTNTSTGYLIPTVPPGTVTGRQVTPTLAPGQVPQPEPDVCIYGGKTYRPGQRWTDGCEYDCLCEGQGIGKYTCTEICPDYSVIPAQCTLVADPVNPCCKIPFCDQNKPTPPMIPPQATLVPGLNRNACLYNGVPYFQDSHWNDGCESTCVCEDSTINKYRCDQRCQRYDSVPEGCSLETDPKDACCQVAICYPSDIPNPAPVPYPTPYPIPAKLPGKTTGQSVGNNTGFCQYNGVSYRQDETWDDGCLARCVCLDQVAGIYDCTQRCVEFVQLPQTCQLVPDPTDVCCSVPKCGGEATTMSPTPGTPPTPSPQPVTPSPTITPAPDSPPTPSPRPGVTTPTVSPKPVTASPTPGGPPTPSPAPGVTKPTVSPKPGTASPTPGGPPTPSPRPGVTSPTVSPKPGTASPTPGGPPTPSPAPGVTTPTISPKPGTASPTPGNPPTPSPAPGTTSSTKSPQTDVCVYKGQWYTQGQVWYDGCAEVCRCENSRLNYTMCSQRCKQYSNVPNTCTMIPDPDDPACCSVPVCDPGTGQTVTGLTGRVTGFGTPPSGVTATPIYGTYTPVSLTNTCIYKGVAYATGQRWRDGCDYSCECMDGVTGRYECVEICPTYPNPDGCPLVRETFNPCCLVPSCTPDPRATPLPAPTPYPLQVSTLVPQTAFCMYQGTPYKQYAQWHDGCDLNCRCEEASLNQINCDQRCPDYANFPATCTLVTDPNDACCQIPLCAPSPGATPAPDASPAPGATPSPGLTVTGVRGTFTGSSGTPTDPNKQDTCIYHGSLYNKGDSWEDGCSFNCTCEGQAQGLYSCTERCRRYPVTPQGCQLIPDPTDACCEVLDCAPSAFPSPTLAPKPGSRPSTLSPPLAGMCVYNGQSYRQDQVWYDGCNLLCTCDDANNNFYTCRNRCPQYGAVDRSCVMIPDPQDPACCTVPNCPLLQPGPLPTPGPVTVTQSPGKLVGIGMVPTPTPMATPASYTGTTPPPPTPQPGCMYKGQVYRQADQWSDGCDWNCQCMDETTGLYSCSSRCPSQYFNNLPQQCVLVQDPSDSCCNVPYCDFVNPTPFPNGLPTKVPGQIPITVTGSGTGIQGANEFCVYSGSFFREGETWNDGCDLTCTCDEAKSGFYTCRQRCGDYFGLPDTCSLVADPGDQCCLIPSCTPSSNPTPTPGPNSVIIPVPPLTFTGRGGQPQQPDGPGSSNTGYNNVCVYKGQTYQQDQDFDDGCQYKCTCVDALYGKFRCTERCAKYENLPPSCQLVEDPTDICCQVPKCATPPPAPATPTTAKPVTKPTASPTTRRSTTVTTVVPPTTSPPPSNVCVYDSKYHVQGDIWTSLADCSLECTCDDAATGHYTCANRCPVYAELPSFCTLVADPASSCCRQPRCVVDGKVVTNAVPIGTVTVTGGNSGTGTQLTGTGKQVCQYGGKTYQPGEGWFDGCDKTCSCSEDGGYYTCVSRCPDFSSLNPTTTNCSLQALPGRCCPAIQCENSVTGGYSPASEITAVSPKNPSPGSSPQVWVVPGTTTGGATLPGGGYPVPSKIADYSGLRDKCVYKNQLYNEGEAWNDGCDLTCRCLDGDTGFYSCQRKCLQYDANLLPNGCSLVSTGCCMVPECRDPNGVTFDPVANPSPGMIPVVATRPGKLTGVRPAVLPEEGGIVTGSRNACVYKTQTYAQGQSWQDGCVYNCQCVDGNLGLYTCTPLCPVYEDLPTRCRVKAPPQGQCCGDLECDPFPTSPTPTGNNPSPSSPSPGPTAGTTAPGVYDPQCHDTLSNCKAYESSSCGGIYESWARSNCNLTCGYCLPSYTTTPPPCVDLKNCRLYDADTCTKYQHWAETNCRKHCGFCSPDGYPPTTQTPTTTTPASTECLDRVNCKRYGASVCTDPQYTNWVVKNCPQFCGLCNACEYKNVSYRQGDTWKDGCDLDCTYLNATSGRYICNNKCPTYPNLPAGCQLVTKPGQCCQQLECQGIAVTKGCYYKNVAYSEGAQWTDGCDFDCVCLNSTTGDFKCKTICPRWNIPDQCTIGEPEPGLCCGLPKCPFPWSPPADYVPR